MELLLVGVIVLAAGYLLIRHIARAVSREEPSCCSCSSCPLPEQERRECADSNVTVSKNAE